MTRLAALTLFSASTLSTGACGPSNGWGPSPVQAVNISVVDTDSGVGIERASVTANGIRAAYRLPQPTLGGSVPLVTIETALHTHTIMIPLANFDHNQHTANGNVRIGHLWNAIDSFAALFTMH